MHRIAKDTSSNQTDLGIMGYKQATCQWFVRVMILCLALIFIHSSVNSSFAQTFPTKLIRWVVPSSPGDGTDIAGRIVAEKVSRFIGQPIIIDNKPSAGGILGSEIVAKSPSDGYTMIVGNAGSHGINPAIYTNLNYDPTKDFVPVALICVAPNVLVINPQNPANNLKEFIAFAKSKNGSLDYASGGIGSSAHLSAELFKSFTGIEMNHIPYKGASKAGLAVAANEVSMMIGNLPPLTSLINGKKLNAIAVTSTNRYKDFPDVPALAELLPGFETVAWFGIFAPANTPKAIIEQMNLLVNKALSQADTKSRLISMDCEPAPTTSLAFDTRVQNDIARWKKLVSERKIIVN